MASFPGYTVVSVTEFQIHYHITITLLHLTSGSMWIGSIVIYKVMLVLIVTGKYDPVVLQPWKNVQYNLRNFFSNRIIQISNSLPDSVLDVHNMHCSCQYAVFSADGCFVLQAPIVFWCHRSSDQPSVAKLSQLLAQKPEAPCHLPQSECTFCRQLKTWLFKKSFPDIII